VPHSTEDFERLSGHVSPWKPERDERLSEAWARCPDARWMLATAVESGARPRMVTRAVVGCIRAVLPELDDQPPWRGLLHVADAYGRGEMDVESLRQLLPAGTPSRRGSGSDPSPATEWASAAREVIGGSAGRRDGLSQVVASSMLRALDPDAAAVHGARDLPRMMGVLATLAGLSARADARETAEDMLTEHRISEAPGVPMMLPDLESPAWDEAAQAGYRHALRTCSDRVRELVRPPWRSP